MHELAMTKSLVDAVQKEAAGLSCSAVAVTRVRVGMGALIYVDRRVMGACYEAYPKPEILEKSVLDIEIIPARALCRPCGSESLHYGPPFECPSCGSAAEPVSGTDFTITGIEWEDAF